MEHVALDGLRKLASFLSNDITCGRISGVRWGESFPRWCQTKWWPESMGDILLGGHCPPRTSQQQPLTPVLAALIAPVPPPPPAGMIPSQAAGAVFIAACTVGQRRHREVEWLVPGFLGPSSSVPHHPWVFETLNAGQGKNKYVLIRK